MATYLACFGRGESSGRTCGESEERELHGVNSSWRWDVKNDVDDGKKLYFLQKIRNLHDEFPLGRIYYVPAKICRPSQ